MMKSIIIILTLFLADRTVLSFKCTRPNEFLNPCPLPCIPGKITSCYQYFNNEPYPCDSGYPMEGECVPRCECKEGFLRDDQGRCVRKEECCTEPNTELVECPDPCPATCANFETWRSNECLKPCRPRGCVCKPGFVVNYGDGVGCIPEDECTAGCGENEYFEACIPCGPGQICTFKCNPGCLCKENYAKPPGSDKCEPVENTCGLNEDFGIGSADATCGDPNFVWSLRNRLGCFCKKGYVRDNRQLCVRVEDCPNSRCDPNLNEVFGRAVADGTCNDPDLRSEDKEPRYGCFCPEGYLRSHQNVCVLPEDCKKCGPNEVYKTSPRDPTCDSPYEFSSDPDFFDCYCRQGYVRDENRNCVLIEDCPNNCKSGEVYRWGNCNTTCADGYPDDCRAPDIFGCFCKLGYTRNSNNRCIPQENCVVKCRKDEELNVCPRYCTIEKSCATEFQGDRILCIPEQDDYVCQPRCECKKGLLRLAGKCVKPKQCCKDPNEVPADCPQPCEETCDTIPDPGCTIKNCDKKVCICRPGYVRRSENDSTCIRRSKCAKRRCKGPNERYNECGNCDGTCDNPNPICIQACVPGCYCRNGYVRDDDGVCIPYAQCNWNCYDDDDYLFKRWVVRHFRTLKGFLKWIRGKVHIKFDKHNC